MMQDVQRAPSDVRLLAGLAALPIVSAVLAAAVFPLVYLSGQPLWGGGTIADPAGAAVGFGLAVGILGFVMTFAGALPTVLWLQKRGRLELKPLLLAGLIIGNAPFVLIVIGTIAYHVVRGTAGESFAQFWYGWYGAARSIAIGTMLGAGSALAFWLVAVRRHE